MTSELADDDIPLRLAVLGAGVMGTGIAALALGHGLPVTLIDVDEARLAPARDQIGYQLRAARLMGALPEGRPDGELITDSSLAPIAAATVLVEAITEVAQLKVAALARAAAVMRPGTPVISNTSAIPVDELAAGLAVPETLAGVHFMNPPYAIRQVEVIRGPRTSDRTLSLVLRALAALDRQSVVVADAPGFVTSRLLHPMINDAARIVGEGTATAAQVDALMQGCLGHRTGPLATADLIGLDNLVDALRVLHDRTGAPACRPCDVLLGKVARGELGRKTGKGFYEYGKAWAS